MLQQTQVKTVIPYFNRWVKRFPDFARLARAKEATVLKYWEGLGYYSRARNLHSLAQRISQLDRIPEDPDSWQAFKGVGTYTAAAITSIRFQHPVACVDGNVIRILARLTADQTVFKDNNQAVKRLSPLAVLLLDENNPGRHNEAMMELGATVCTKLNPHCNSCPLAGGCKARSMQPEKFPYKRTQKRSVEKTPRAWVIENQRVLLHRANKESRRLTHILELPPLKLLDLTEDFLSESGQSPLKTKRRGISNSLVIEPIWEIQKMPPINHPDLEWHPLGELSKVTLSGPHKRWIQEMLSDRQLELF